MGATLSKTPKPALYGPLTRLAESGIDHYLPSLSPLKQILDVDWTTSPANQIVHESNMTLVGSKKEEEEGMYGGLSYLPYGTVMNGTRQRDLVSLTQERINCLLDELEPDDEVQVYILRAPLISSLIRGGYMGLLGMAHLAIAFKRVRPYTNHVSSFEHSAYSKWNDRPLARPQNGWVLDFCANNLKRAFCPNIIKKSGQEGEEEEDDWKFNNEWDINYSDGIDVGYFSMPVADVLTQSLYYKYEESIIGQFSKPQLRTVLNRMLQLKDEALFFSPLQVLNKKKEVLVPPFDCMNLPALVVSYLEEFGRPVLLPPALRVNGVMVAICGNGEVQQLGKQSDLSKNTQSEMVTAFKQLNGFVTGVSNALFSPVTGAPASLVDGAVKISKILFSQGSSQIPMQYAFDGTYYYKLPQGAYLTVVQQRFDTTKRKKTVREGMAVCLDSRVRLLRPPNPTTFSMWPCCVGAGVLLLGLLVVLVVCLIRSLSTPFSHSLAH